ncbi:hypothetical protein ACP4OV_005712 [Aristida adscensionis]
MATHMLIKLRALLTHLQQLCIGYWGVATGKSQQLQSYAMTSPRALDVSDESQQPAEASGFGRSWVHIMFRRDRKLRSTSFNRSNVATAVATTGKTDIAAAQKKTQTNMRTLRGHQVLLLFFIVLQERRSGILLVIVKMQAFFISGSTDCTRTIRAISSDRGKIVSGADDQSVIVWDKLKGHDAHSVWMLSGERVLTASHDGNVKMWDVRTDSCVATVGRCQSAVLCMEYDDSPGILVAAGIDVVPCLGYQF